VLHVPVLPQGRFIVQVVPQQTPLTQKPLMHSIPVPHPRPLALRAQLFVVVP
jgi:hypothetical protein